MAEMSTACAEKTWLEVQVYHNTFNRSVDVVKFYRTIIVGANIYGMQTQTTEGSRLVYYQVIRYDAREKRLRTVLSWASSNISYTLCFYSSDCVTATLHTEGHSVIDFSVNSIQLSSAAPRRTRFR